MQGVFAGAIGVARGCVAGITDQSNEGRAYAILGSVMPFCFHISLLKQLLGSAGALEVLQARSLAEHVSAHVQRYSAFILIICSS